MCESKPEDHRDDCGRSIELSSRCLLKDIPGKQFGPAGKRVQIILLDTRTFKDDPRRNPRSKAEKKAAGLSGSMGNYPPERRRLFDLVAAKKCRRCHTADRLGAFRRTLLFRWWAILGEHFGEIIVSAHRDNARFSRATSSASILSNVVLLVGTG
jgi:hypothetical protein